MSFIKIRSSSNSRTLPYVTPLATSTGSEDWPPHTTHWV